jgi:hypothetical protein
MLHSIEIHKDLRMAQVKAWGRVTSRELKNMFIETVNHQDSTAGLNMLFDYNYILILM